MSQFALASWQPSCTPENLVLRARLLAAIRDFFARRGVLEVETPLLGHGIGTDPNLHFFTTDYQFTPQAQTLFLQTSPEFAMKRLLAAGSGSIYQICKAFRNGEQGRFHNPEFSLLEWYRLDFDLKQLMDEIEALIHYLFANKPLERSERISYTALFAEHTGLDALHFCYDSYCAYAKAGELHEAIALCQQQHEVWLDFIFSHKIQPLLGNQGLCLVHGYPACLSSLARLDADNPLVTQRVELFINGVECGNGFYELTDAHEQAQRFTQESEYRHLHGLAKVSADSRLLGALHAGLPDCAGMAIGIDRLLMLLSNSPHIAQVLSFAIDSA